MSSPGYFGKEVQVGVHCHAMSFRNRSRGGLTGGRGLATRQAQCWLCLCQSQKRSAEATCWPSMKGQAEEKKCQKRKRSRVAGQSWAAMIVPLPPEVHDGPSLCEETQ